METLCTAIPCLAGKPGTKPWEPLTLADWYGYASSGERAAIAFVLYVWNDNVAEWRAWKLPPFDIDAFRHMDAPTQAVVAKWFANPFNP